MILALFSTFVGPLYASGTVAAAPGVLHSAAGTLTTAAPVLAAAPDPATHLWVVAAAVLGALVGVVWPYYENRQPGEPFSFTAAGGALLGSLSVVVAAYLGADTHATGAVLLTQCWTAAVWAFGLATAGQKLHTALARGVKTAAGQALDTLASQPVGELSPFAKAQLSAPTKAPPCLCPPPSDSTDAQQASPSNQDGAQ